MDEKGTLRIHYDGECPFCTRYVQYLRIKQSVGNAELIDLRQEPEQRARFRDQGLDPDKGMIVEYGGRTYGGADAMNILTGLSTPAGLFAFGVFGFLHFLVYAYQFKAEMYPTTYLVGLAGIGLALFPLSRRLFLVLVLCLAVDGVLQAPMFSNHTIIKNFLIAGILTAGIQAWMKGESWTWFIEQFAPLGRWLLLIMYFYGVFHKINTDFLNPDVSCATALWLVMPFPEIVTDSRIMHLLGVIATFAVEGLIVICLLLKRLRHLGIMMGVGFHALLALSGYAMYAPFSMLTISLHCLFLPAYSHTDLAKAGKVWESVARLKRLPGSVLVLIYATGLWFLGWNGSYAQQGILWLAIPVGMILLINSCTKQDAGRRNRPASILKAPLIQVLIIALFVFNGMTPYLGLKTAQSINMFANLRLEAGVSNHLILHEPPWPFGYLEDIVEIESSSGAPYLISIENRDLHLTYYSMLNHMERAPDSASVSYIRDGELHENVSRNELVPEFERVLHPRWFRAWFHFAPVDLTRPKPCALDR